MSTTITSYSGSQVFSNTIPLEVLNDTIGKSLPRDGLSVSAQLFAQQAKDADLTTNKPAPNTGLVNTGKIELI